MRAPSGNTDIKVYRFTSFPQGLLRPRRNLRRGGTDYADNAFDSPSSLEPRSKRPKFSSYDPMFSTSTTGRRPSYLFIKNSSIKMIDVSAEPVWF